MSACCTHTGYNLGQLMEFLLHGRFTSLLMAAGRSLEAARAIGLLKHAQEGTAQLTEQGRNPVDWVA